MMQWIVTTRIKDRAGKLPTGRSHVRIATPDDFNLPAVEELKHEDVYRDFFDSEADAIQFASENVG